jgi:integrating conjugative element protein (TIGR03757 family)
MRNDRANAGFRFGCVALALFLSAAHTASAQTSSASPVEVFGTSTMPFTNVGSAQVYYLDSISQLEAYLSSNLPADPKQAQAIAQQRMQVMGPQLQERAQNGATGLSRALQIGIDRAPAVVFSSKWVVYGLTDVDLARRIFAAKAAQRR